MIGILPASSRKAPALSCTVAARCESKMLGQGSIVMIRLGYLPETIYIIRYANRNPITQMTVVPTADF